jgi:hypothetical protein
MQKPTLKTLWEYSPLRREIRKSQAWRHMPKISVHGKLRQEAHEFKASLGYKARPVSKN